MITLIYHIPYTQKYIELEWLHEQHIYPGIREGWDNGPTVVFACIVSPETALVIKLRHKLDLQDNYEKR